MEGIILVPSHRVKVDGSLRIWFPSYDDAGSVLVWHNWSLVRGSHYDENAFGFVRRCFSSCGCGWTLCVQLNHANARLEERHSWTVNWLHKGAVCSDSHNWFTGSGG